MKYIAAYLLAQSAGDASPSKDKVKSILESVGIVVNTTTLDALYAKLENQDISALIAEGSSKLTVVAGGGAAAASGPASGQAAAAEKPEEKKKEEEEVVEMAGGFDDLFG
jgi:large subunit ribosomal protein LP2